METGLKGKAGIVTGGGHGIGRGYCIGLAKEGAKVVVADIDLAAAEETKSLIEKEGGTALALGPYGQVETWGTAGITAVIKAGT